jgi:hypothetical protein
MAKPQAQSNTRMQQLHHKGDSNDRNLLELLALTSPTTSPPAISTSTAPGDTPGPIGESFFAKCININLPLQ